MGAAATSVVILFGLSVSCGPVAAEDEGAPPIVVRADMPLYPRLAQLARIQGTVVVDLKVKDGVVITAEARSGHTLLKQAAIENVKSWRFAPSFSGTLTTAFYYRIRGRATLIPRNPKVEMRLPKSVVITVTPPHFMADNAHGHGVGVCATCRKPETVEATMEL